MAIKRKFTRRKKYFLTKIDNVQVNIIMVHVDINTCKSQDNIIMLHVEIIYLACRGQKYATIQLDSHAFISSFARPQDYFIIYDLNVIDIVMMP